MDATTIGETERKRYTNWTKFAQIPIKLVQNSYEFHGNLCIHTPAQTFVRVCTKFVRKARKHTKMHRGHTLQSHVHVIDHSPTFGH